MIKRCSTILLLLLSNFVHAFFLISVCQSSPPFRIILVFHFNSICSIDITNSVILPEHWSVNNEITCEEEKIITQVAKQNISENNGTVQLTYTQKLAHRYSAVHKALFVNHCECCSTRQHSSTAICRHTSGFLGP